MGGKTTSIYELKVKSILMCMISVFNEICLAKYIIDGSSASLVIFMSTTINI